MESLKKLETSLLKKMLKEIDDNMVKSFIRLELLERNEEF